MTRPFRLRYPAAPLTATLALAAALVIALLAGSSAAVEFVEGVDDLPLMQGLSPVAEAGMVFDSPAGRIVQGVAAGPIEPAEILAFYRTTLPQLGWREVAPRRFRREDEILELTVEAGEGLATVSFRLGPAAGQGG